MYPFRGKGKGGKEGGREEGRKGGRRDRGKKVGREGDINKASISSEYSE